MAFPFLLSLYFSPQPKATNDRVVSVCVCVCVCACVHVCMYMCACVCVKHNGAHIHFIVFCWQHTPAFDLPTVLIT